MLSIIIPARNEADNLEDILNYFEENLLEHEEYYYVISTFDIKPMEDRMLAVPCGTNGFGTFYQELSVWIYEQKIRMMDNMDYDSLNPKSKLRAEGKVMGLSSYGEFDIESSIIPSVPSSHNT